MRQGYDAIVVGAGPNGLVAANHLIDHGWSVLVLEAQPDVGGAVRSDRELHPDFVSDTFSAFYPLAAVSRAITSLKLEDHGLRWSHAPAVLGHALPDGRWATLHRDRAITAATLDDLHAGDGDRWLELCAAWDVVGEPLIEALTGPYPPVRAGLRVANGVRRAGGLDLARLLATPAASIASEVFGGVGPGLLIAGNAAHADLPLDSPGSGAFGILMSMLGQTVGFPVPVGGAGELTAAMARRFTSRGGVIVTAAEVTVIEVENGRAKAVVTTDGTHHRAQRAVLADVSALRLFNGLVATDHLPTRLDKGMDRFELDPGTVKVDWALSGPVPWTVPPPFAAGTVHVGTSVEEMTRALGQVASRTIPEKPFLLAGQMTTSDPTRSPTGTESMWAYTHVPQPGPSVRDGGDGSIRGSWDAADCERFADRMQARIEDLAPGFGSRIIVRRVLGPHELEARDANLIGGAINGGTSQIHQELMFRPVPAMRGRPETGIGGLYLASASAHPGGGVHGAAGANAARAAVLHDRLRWGRR
ncbi:NAD(P)/FAD-dependent oxidoreductase [Nocardioides salsibiostraticola]